MAGGRRYCGFAVGEAVTDDDIKVWVQRQIERVKIEIRIDMCQAAIQRLKAELVLLQDDLRKLEP